MYENAGCDKNMSQECAPKPDSIKDIVQNTKGILAELLSVMGDTNMQLFADSPVEKVGSLEGKCFADDARIVHNQAQIALAMMYDMKRNMIG